MKHGLPPLFLAFLFVFPASADDVGIATYVQYKRGSPVTLRLSYRGEIQDWDAGASIANRTLILSNAMFISITNEKNETVPPLKDKVLSVWADTFFRDPFDLVIDISEFYDLSRPGSYVVLWGCKDVKTDSVVLEIVD